MIITEKTIGAKASVIYRYKIELDTMSDVREFVAAAAKCDDEIAVRTGELRVSAKSFLGVTLARKLNWNDITIESEHDHYGEFRRFIVD